MTILSLDTCPNPIPAHGALKSYSDRPLANGRFAIGEKAYLECDEGYSYARTHWCHTPQCIIGGYWDPKPGECIPNAEGKLKRCLDLVVDQGDRCSH